jgi:hypothetical protein
MVSIVHPIATQIIRKHARRNRMRWYWRAIRRKTAEDTAGRIGKRGGTKVMDAIRGVVVHIVHSDRRMVQRPEAAVKAAEGS